MKYQELNIDLEMGTKYLIKESAYFLGGIIAANESVVSKGTKYWITPVRYNSKRVSSEQLEEHFKYVKTLATKLSNNTLMANLIRNNGLNSGKFHTRYPGFGTFFRTKDEQTLEEMITEVKKALFSSTQEVKRSFIVGMFDSRGSVDRSQEGILRNIVLDCDNDTAGDFLCEVVDNYGLIYNYNKARKRLGGGKPRKNQLRIPARENYLERIGFISTKKFIEAAGCYDLTTVYNVMNEDNILSGLKTIERR